MPGPYIHISAMRNAALRMERELYRPAPSQSDHIDPAWPGADTTALSSFMREHRNFATLGAIGPDLFFFLPDFRDEYGISISSVLTKVLLFLEDLYSSVDPYISKWEKYLGPISEDTAEEMSRLTGGLSETVGDISGELSSILIGALEKFVTQQVDWFGYFSLGLNQGFDEQAYYWSDMLHYRGTGQFGHALWRNANSANDDTLRAYALGYITHLATDVTGHAFINSIAGGPYRQHWQRHHLVENHCDAFWYLGDLAEAAPHTIGGYNQYTESALYYDIAFGDNGSVVTRPSFPTGNTLRDNWERRRLLDIDSSLPDSIAALLTQSMKDTFYVAGVQHPKILSGDGRPSDQQVAAAYDLLFRFLKYATVDGFSHEPPDPPPVFGNLDFPTPTDPGSDSSPAGGGGGGGNGGSFWDELLSFILAIVNAITYVLEVVTYILTLPLAIIADVLNYPLRYLLYLALELPLFHLLKDFRAVMVLTGYFSPMEDEIATSLVQIGTTSAESFDQVKAEMGDAFGGLQQNPPPPSTERFVPPVYPTLNSNTGQDADKEYHHPWAYPQTKLEPFATTVGPYAVGADPSVLFADIPTSPILRDEYETADSPQTTESYASALTPQSNLGDPVTFSEYLLWLSTRDDNLYEETISIVDWNLDSDRGYAYKCWDWNRHQEDNPPKTDDPEGNPFIDPCTWPSQSDGNRYDFGSPQRLQIHYVPGADPGCSVPGENIK
jgi:hypothetical protein